MNKVLYPKDKVLGGIWGLIIGDAVGVPYEFNLPSNIPKLEDIDIITPKNFRKTYGDIAFGTYSDDSAQFLCIIDSYIECNGFDIENLAKKIFYWLKDGLWAVDNEVFDVGNQTLLALTEYARGASPLESGFCNPEAKGNGSLMRTLGLAFFEHDSDEELVFNSQQQSLITHGHICNQICCAFYNLVASYLLKGLNFEKSYEKAVNTLRSIYKEDEKYLDEFEQNILPDGVVELKGTGYVIDCLKSCFEIIRNTSSYEEAIKKSIAMGYDTDTTAAVVGGLAGIIYGFESIPTRWYEILRGKDEILGLIDKINFEDL